MDNEFEITLKGMLAQDESRNTNDVVMVSVVNADQARKVIYGSKGLLEAARPNLIICLISTVALSVVKELADICTKHQVGFMDCGVTPGDKAAQNGMVAIVGGDTDIVRRAMPVLEDWSKKVVHCGPIGAGMATKIARNVITYGSWLVVKEAQRLAQAAGVDQVTLLEVIETSDPEGRMLLTMLRQNDNAGKVSEASARRTMPLMTKDLDAAYELAKALRVDMPVTAIVRSHALDTLDLK